MWYHVLVNSFGIHVSFSCAKKREKGYLIPDDGRMLLPSSLKILGSDLEKVRFMVSEIGSESVVFRLVPIPETCFEIKYECSLISKSIEDDPMSDSGYLNLMRFLSNHWRSYRALHELNWDHGRHLCQIKGGTLGGKSQKDLVIGN
ncbi:hypothetical protein NE237_013962 [Protea cynaroides]|uniref:Uncharacterized protein n=1 Tax=Protea cynaroides TaxID=273540 RepID=A0A9Q0H0W1_9MAGN|nr:hypothetical protein NE237_013962 [Protea cynaroides]